MKEKMTPSFKKIMADRASSIHIDTTKANHLSHIALNIRPTTSLGLICKNHLQSQTSRWHSQHLYIDQTFLRITVQT
jgi:hypothetical protein